MPYSRSRAFVSAIMVATLSVATGCAGAGVWGLSLATDGMRIQPEPATSLSEVERFVLMPVADERRDDARFEAVEVGRHVRDATQRLLAGKGYAVLERDFFAEVGQAADAGVANMSGEDLAALGPSGERTLLFISVRQVEEYYDTGGEAFRIALSAMVVDTETRSVVWRGTGMGTSNLGGFMKAFVGGQGQYDAVYEAVRDMLRSVPERTA